MKREYLEDYKQKERTEYERLLKRIQEGKFCFEKDRFPSDERFVNLQKPVAVTTLEGANVRNLWAQIPFCGSLIISLPPFQQSIFERELFKVSEIPKIIDFIKETGKLQVALSSADVLAYEGLNYLDPFFKELKPPVYTAISPYIWENVKEVQKVVDTFYTLGRVKYLNFLWKLSQPDFQHGFPIVLRVHLAIYITLKLGHYTVVEDIENLMIDNPEEALSLFSVCGYFILSPIRDLRSQLRNFTLEDIRTAQVLPFVYQPQERRFPCEIGKFLLKKLTYAPKGLRACNELIDHYDAYDLRKVQESLNEAIVTNYPDIVNKSAEELSEILDNVWCDKTIPQRVKGLQIGVPLSMTAIGSTAAGPIGTIGGFLAGLGYSVADKFIDLETEGLSERLAKLKAKSYQANIYDFKKKYKGKIARP